MYGWPVLVHYCDDCHYNTPITYSSTVWIEQHICSHCGTSSPGADVAGSSPVEMNQGQHDELARLFEENMRLSQAAHHQLQQQLQQPQQTEPTPVEHVIQEQSSEKAETAAQLQQQQPVHFISSHYTGTAHVRPHITTSEPSRSPPPPYHEAVMPEAMAEALRQHSIDPSALLPNQIHLFVNADDEQRYRLIELWRIAPPSYPLEEHLSNAGTWGETSVEREEELARIRYEESQQQQRQQEQMFASNNVLPGPVQHHHFEEHMLDTHLPPSTRTPEPISPIREPGEPAWPPAARMRAASIAAGKPVSRPETRQGGIDAEPYIVNGYASDQGVKATDPVYAAAAGLWQAPSYAQAMEQQQHMVVMADQYGMYEQIRNHADWERMNERIASEKLGHFQHVSASEDEMEL